HHHVQWFLHNYFGAIQVRRTSIILNGENDWMCSDGKVDGGCFPSGEVRSVFGPDIRDNFSIEVGGRPAVEGNCGSAVGFRIQALMLSGVRPGNFICGKRTADGGNISRLTSRQ